MGVAVTAIGVAITTQYSDERDVRIAPGGNYAVGEYEYRFVFVEPVQGPNYKADRALFEVYHDGEKVAQLHPEKRSYASKMGGAMTEASIWPGLFKDLYIAMGEKLEDGAWAVRLHYKPFVRWVWLGGVFMACGGILTICDRRYRLKKALSNSRPEVSAVINKTVNVEG